MAGTIVSVGEGVTAFEPGDSVFGWGIGNGEYQGSYAEYATVPTESVVTVPDAVDLTQAGAAGVAATTAWYSLITHAGVEPTEHCLVHGGSGGVGHVAVQISNAAGAHTTTTAAPDYHDEVDALGAEQVIDYGRDDLADAIVEASDGGVDVVLDHRMDDYLQLNATVANLRGRIVGIGQNQPDPSFSNVSAVRRKDLVYHFVSTSNTRDMKSLLNGVADLMATGDLTIELARTYDLDDAPEAHRAVMEDSFFGKLAIIP